MACTTPTTCDTRIFLTEIAGYDPTTHTVYTNKPDIVFEHASALIDFLIRNTRLNYYKRNYECIYMTEQNLTGNDTTAIYETRSTGDSLYTERHETLKKYWFHDKKNRTIDVRIFMPTIVKKLKYGYKPAYNRSRQYPKKRYHTHIRYKKETYIQTVKHDYPVEYELNGCTYKLQPRKRDLTHSSISARSSGWKNNKYKRQWMHNQNKGCDCTQP